ncbi:putative phosphoric monoester hydrolase [Helianthus annuus]|nr:putative phosphoric monoester hydrolase [Helianthus annuus]
MSSSSSPKIVAEYAKSGKSSCKKCSEKIDSKSLRLGLKIRDPRGFDSVKWHHFGCFSSLDSVSVSETDIEGFSQLTVGFELDFVWLGFCYSLYIWYVWHGAFRSF